MPLGFGESDWTIRREDDEHAASMTAAGIATAEPRIARNRCGRMDAMLALVMIKRIGCMRTLVAGVVGGFFLLSGAVLSPAVAGNQDPGPNRKVTDSNQWSLPLDVTGDAVASAERDRLSTVLKDLQVYDGGMVWDGSTKTLTVQMTSDAAIEQAGELIAASSTSMRINFVRVQYSEKDLDELASNLLGDQVAWAGASGIGGGYDPKSNRVLLQVDAKYKDAETLIGAIKNLNDPRVSLQILESVGGGPESRVADYAPWAVGAKITSS